MKKTITTLAIILGLTTTTLADPNGGGLFQRGEDMTEGHRTVTPMLPNGHGLSDNQNADSPLGSGIVLLTALGAAYLVTKKHKEE